MLPEHQVVNYVHHAVLLAAVFLTDNLQNLDLHQRLLVEPGLVSDYLQRAVALRLVVLYKQHLPEAAAAQDLEDLVPVSDVVQHLDLVVATLVVEAVVEPAVNFVLAFPRFHPDAEDLVVAQDLRLLVLAQTTGELGQD